MQAGATIGSTYQGSGSSVPGCPLNFPRREGDLGNWAANSNGGILGSVAIPIDAAAVQLLGAYSFGTRWRCTLSPTTVQERSTQHTGNIY